jgi:hypothetical protein
MPKPITAPIAAEVRQDQESEAALIASAKQAITTCNWKVGEAAAMWTARWAKGRTDADFGAAVDLTGDQVGQRRRVWERWGEKLIPYRNLSWSHFAVSVAWEDADTYLEWAYANQATVSEMKAYRHAKTANEFLPPAGERGGDPFVEAGPEDDPFGVTQSEVDAYLDGIEAAGAATTEAAEEFLDGMEAEVEEEEASRPPRNGREAPAEVDPKEVFQTTKAKAVKTLEAGMRAVDDLQRLRKIPQHDKLIKGLEKMLQTVKEVS